MIFQAEAVFYPGAGQMKDGVRGEKREGIPPKCPEHFSFRNDPEPILPRWRFGGSTFLKIWYLLKRELNKLDSWNFNKGEAKSGFICSRVFKMRSVLMIEICWHLWFCDWMISFFGWFNFLASSFWLQSSALRWCRKGCSIYLGFL